MNGRRVTEAILENIPKTSKNLETFKLTLRCIKLWAKNRGIYSNVHGYCGGVAWAILVAYICKENPNLECCQLLYTFFKYYRNRRWTNDNPLHIGEIKNNLDLVKFPIDNKITYWNPAESDRSAYFPVITPAFPSMNSTYNVSLTTRNVIINELEKAMEITK